MSVSPAVTHYLESYRERRDTLPGRQHRWLAQARETAIARFEALGFPGPRDEDWKYTRVAALQRQPFRPAPQAGAEITAGTVERHAGRTPPGCCRLVFVDGHLSPAHSVFGDAGDSVVAMGLREALERPPASLESHLGRYANRGDFAFAALNTAFVDDGAFIHLDRGASLRHPIHLVFVSSGRAADIVAHPRVLIVAETGSRARVVEHYIGAGNGVRCFNNAVCEVVLKAGACVEHYKVQVEGDQAFHVASLEVHQAHESRFTSHLTSLGGRLMRQDINVRLDSPQTRCDLLGLFLATGRQHMDFHTRVDHLEPHGTSNEVYKGVLDGRARGVFNGRVIVHPGAQKSDARQASANLLLSPHAEIDTKPQLEIHADDVKCAHGATVGQLDESMLFYLRSRGIDEAHARGLLTFGFLGAMLEAVPLPWLRESLSRDLVRRMPHAPRLHDLDLDALRDAP